MINKELIKQLEEKERETQNQLTKLLIYKASDEVKAEKRGERNAYREAIVIAKKVEQPTLNENQQFVLDELKINTDYYKFNKFQAVFWFLTNLISYPDGLIAKTYKELEQYELEQVFQVFSQLDLEQEEEI